MRLDVLKLLDCGNEPCVRDAPESVRLPIICSPFGLQESVDDVVDAMFPVRLYSGPEMCLPWMLDQAVSGSLAGLVWIVGEGWYEFIVPGKGAKHVRDVFGLGRT
jgi:hypothetical protein